MFNNIFGNRNKDDNPIVNSPSKGEPVYNGFFRTDISLRNLNVKSFFKKNAITEIPEFKKIDGVGDDQFAIDGAHTAMDEGTLNKAFALNQQVMPDSLFSWYTSQSFIGHQACALLSQHWLIDKACTAAAEDAVCNGYNINFPADNEIDADFMMKLRKTDKKYKIHKNLIEFEKFNRVFGIRVALFVVDSSDKDYYKKPFNIDGVKKGKYKGISQIDPYWVTPELNSAAVAEPASIDFYEPTYWRISGRLYHKSHLVITRYSEVPDIYKPTYIYGGLPLTQLIYERVYASERTANEGPMLAMTKRTTSINVDMEAAITNEEVFMDKMERWVALRDNFAVKTLGLDETISETDTSLADLDAVIMTQYQLVAAIANTPATRLLGTSPKGFNATGENELKVYHESLESIQENNLNSMVERHYQLVLKSDFNEKKEFDIDWSPVDAPTQKEEADINQTKSITALNYSNIGAIDGLDVREKLATDKNSGYNHLELPETDEEEEIEEDLDATDGTDFLNINGYVSIRPRSNDAMKISDMVRYGADIEGGLMPEDLHITLFYDKTPEGIPETDLQNDPRTAYPTNEFKILGEGEYRALVMMLKSDDLQARHQEIADLGGEHSHDEFLPHISLKYQPEEGDLAKMIEYANSDMFKDSWDNVNFLILHDERWMPAK